jgi:predicted RND superfamily exporter protein
LGTGVPTGSHRFSHILEHTVTRFTTYLLRWRWGVILLLVGVTSGALCGVARLRVDPANDRLLPRQGKDSQVYKRFLTTFGSDEALLVVVYDAQQSLLSSAGLAAVRHLTRALEALPHVAAVQSFVADEPLSGAQIEAIRRNDQVGPNPTLKP